MRLTVGGLKGGIGKTTTSAFLATALALKGKTLLVDADPQSQSMFDWANIAVSRGEELPWECHPWSTADLATKIRAIADQYEHIVIDVGGETSRNFRAAVSVAPELVIPVRPNEIELRRIPATIAAAQEVQDLTGTEVYPRILLVAVDSRATDVDAAREFLDANNIPLMQKHVRQGVLYSRAFGHVPGGLGDYADVLDELEKEIGE